MIPFRGIVVFLSLFLFIGSTRVLIASSNDVRAAASNTSRFDFSAPEGGRFDMKERCVEYPGITTFNIEDAVITADYTKFYLKGGSPLDADSTNIEDKFEKIIFRGNVKIVSEDTVATGDEAIYDSAVDFFVLTGNPAKLLSSSDAMTSAEITAEKIVFNNAELSSDFIGNVTVTQGETLIKADTAKAFFKKGVDDRLSLNMKSTENILESFEKIIADGNVKIVSEDAVAIGDEAVYDSAVGSFVLAGKPAKFSGSADTMPSAEIMAEKIVLNNAEFGSEFIGNVTVTQEETVITADNVKTFFIKNADGRLSLNMDSVERIIADGNVKIVAEDITDTGGETVITADNVKAFFKNKADGRSSLNMGSTENIWDSVEKIIADGNVKAVSEDIVATGDEAAYDSAVNSFVLTGDPATLLSSTDMVTSDKITAEDAEITADKIVLNNSEFSSEFIDNVTVTRGETVMTADNVKAFFKKGADGRLSLNTGSTENIVESFEKIIADGNVKIVAENDFAAGDEAVYDSAVESFVLTGNPATLVYGVTTYKTSEVEIKHIW